MSKLSKCHFKKKLIICEIVAFVILIAVIWLDEVIDLPNLLMGAELTPVNWQEALLESVFVALLGVLMISYTRKLLRRVRILEGLLSICSSCKMIKDAKGNWHQLETFIRDKSEAEFTHGLCPNCYSRLDEQLKRDF